MLFLAVSRAGESTVRAKNSLPNFPSRTSLSSRSTTSIGSARVGAILRSTEWVLVFRSLLALLAVSAVATVVGCGGEGGGGGGQPPPPKPVSKQELRRMLDQAGREVAQSFGRVEQAVNEKDLRGVRQTLLVAADTEERHVQALARVRPPKKAQKPLNQLLTGARAQVIDIRRLVAKEGLTLKDVRREERQTDPADKQVDQALQTLAKRGFASPEPPRD
jgi:hypothetical protein